MKYTTAILSLCSLASLATALPAAIDFCPTPEANTDQLLFGETLSSFSDHREFKVPADLDWTSDGCAFGLGNPLGFPFEPACQRRDFGYRNYRKQKRFTRSAKTKIDTLFQTDLHSQCKSTRLPIICNALAEVFYAFARAFTGLDATIGKRDEEITDTDELIKLYEEKLAEYNKLIEEAKESGEITIAV
ncbi:unnamed protein product [Clonostachys rhizophaga]|uniref:Uncharacterized protein n=1 Tax=Clonostachys rhizophaga TaxID=160324 RepID=A0A9N9YVW3_9HYPO|nr:unnamed protein product [Clonostachys rhizophaga]